ncbi:hypothetical protein [Streptomyces griseus]|uniref:hypothetical protein n=1 Tax=Streptomyces griseus TaxID=1911 RepID=UPI00084053E3|nr:hypothetical protein [Streptomyces griseus]
MGWTVLYIAFGMVALWLLGEVLLQYKARLRWRLLAFAGFLGVVVGVLIPSVLVIAVGAIAFATGQTYVTLSFRRGFSTGWALGGNPGASRRRKASGGGARKPTLEVSGLEYGEAAPVDAVPDPATAVYEPQPLPDDTGQYGVYTDTAGGAPAGDGERQDGQTPYDGYDPYGGYAPQFTPQPQDAYSAQAAYQDPGTFQGHDAGYGDPYANGTPQGDYAAYTDPYTGTSDTPGAGQYASYESYGATYEPYGQQQAEQPLAGPYDPSDTPPGGVWVPQQRGAGQHPPMPPEAPTGPAPYGNGYDTGQNEQYRY